MFQVQSSLCCHLFSGFKVCFIIEKCSILWPESDSPAFVFTIQMQACKQHNPKEIHTQP